MGKQMGEQISDRIRKTIVIFVFCCVMEGSKNNRGLRFYGLLKRSFKRQYKLTL